MFEDNHMEESDLLFRSILENGQEEVPAYVWDGVAAGLDKAARRRTVVLWFGRATAVAAAAAIVAGVFLNKGNENIIVPEASEDMIAVVQEIPANDESQITGETLLANVENIRPVAPQVLVQKTYTPENVATEVEVCEIPERAAEVPTIKKENPRQETPAENTVKTEYAGPVDWGQDEEKERRKISTSIVLSGNAGSNNPQSQGRLGPLKSPGILKAPTKTTIEQTENHTTYGIPLSFGAGMKFNFTERWSLGIGVNYSLLSSSFNGKYTKVEDGVASVPISDDIHNTQHYTGIPVNAYYNIINRDFINFYTYAGGTAEKCILNRYEVQTTPVITHEESVKGMQFSANLGMGVEFLLGKHLGIYIDPSLRYYFSNGQPKSIRTAQPLMLGFEMGLRFNI